MLENNPYRIVLHEKVGECETEIFWGHELSDGFGIPSIVINCPSKRKNKIYSGYDEYGDEVSGIDFDVCSDCKYFGELGFGQEIVCFHRKNKDMNEG